MTFLIVLYGIGFVLEYCSSYKTAVMLDPESKSNVAVAAAVSLIWPLLAIIAIGLWGYEAIRNKVTE